MPDRISNGKLLNMSPGARADTIAGLSRAARDTLANIATLGAARCIRRGMKRVKSPRTVVQAHRDFIDAADLCDLAAELTKRETGESTELYGAVERNPWDDRTTPDAYGKSDADRETALRAERDEAQAWAELIGQAVVGILGIHEDEVPDQVELLRLAQAEASTRERLRAQALIVHAHINQRPEYITALRNNTDTNDDYWRWSGHAAARRQLAEALGLTVPHECGETAQPKAGE